MANKSNTEYEAFDRIMRDLLKVPHTEIKTKLDAEKKTKASRKRIKKLKREKQS